MRTTQRPVLDRTEPAHVNPTTPIPRRCRHFVESERILASLPLATKRGERDQQLQLALVNAVLAIAATMLGEGQAHAE